jgi:hypothetical protein
MKKPFALYGMAAPIGDELHAGGHDGVKIEQK